MKLILHFLMLVAVLVFGFTSAGCKSKKINCPTYSDNPAPTGIPKAGKTKSGVFPPDYKKR